MSRNLKYKSLSERRGQAELIAIAGLMAWHPYTLTALALAV